MNKVKQFIIDNDTFYAKVVENGYDIRMAEDEILKWMQRYADNEVKNLALPQVSKCEDVEREAALIDLVDWMKNMNIDIKYTFTEDIVSEYLKGN